MHVLITCVRVTYNKEDSLNCNLISKCPVFSGGCVLRCLFHITYNERLLNVSPMAKLAQGFTVPKECLQLKITPEVICTFCTGIVRNPVQTLCGHRYCKECLAKILLLVLI